MPDHGTPETPDNTAGATPVDTSRPRAEWQRPSLRKLLIHQTQIGDTDSDADGTFTTS